MRPGNCTSVSGGRFFPLSDLSTEEGERPPEQNTPASPVHRLTAHSTRIAAVAGLLTLWVAILAIAGAGARALALPLFVGAFLVGAVVREYWRPIPFLDRAGPAARSLGRSAIRAGHALRSWAVALAERRRRWKERRFSRSSARNAWELSRAAAEHRRQGRLEAAVVCCEHALAIERSLGDRRGEALTLNSLGLALAQSGSSERANDCFESAAAILAELEERELEAQVLANLANLHARRERHEQQELHVRPV